MLTDPTNEEETMATGMITIVTNEDDELCSVHKPGMIPYNPTYILMLPVPCTSNNNQLANLKTSPN